MKKKLFLAAFTLVCFTIHAQTGQKPKYTIEASSLKNHANFSLYTYCDNELLIKAYGIAPEKLIVTSSKGEISGGEGKYIIKIGIYDIKDNNKIKILVRYLGKGNDTIMLGTTEFTGLEFVCPIISVAGKQGGEIKRSDFMTADSLSLNDSICPIDGQYKISSYKFSIMDQGMIREYTHSKNGKFTTEERNILLKQKSSFKVYFENISVIGPDGKPRYCGSLVFKVVV